MPSIASLTDPEPDERGSRNVHLKPVPDPIPQPPAAGEQPSIAELERYATVLRINCVRMLAVAKSGHLDSSLSAADIVTALYYRVLRHDPKNPAWPERDRFVLSKGHAAPIQYAALAEHGYFPHKDLMGLRQIGSHLQGHPDMTRTPGIEVSTGSLGQGLSMSVGICLALRLDGLHETAQAFTLMSDGDIQEGESWEGGLPWKPKRSSMKETPRPFLVWQTIAAGRPSVRLRSSASTIAPMSWPSISIESQPKASNLARTSPVSMTSSVVPSVCRWL